MVKKIRLLIIFVLLGLVFSSCSNSNNVKESGISFGRGVSSSGDVGVSLEFAQGNPPTEMFKGEAYTFAFVFKNFQEHEITDLEIRPKGFDFSYVKGLFETHRVEKIPKFVKDIGPGVYSGLVVSGVVVDGFIGDYKFNPRFDYCYSAKTQYREQVCVPSKRNTCSNKIKTSLYQNGPLKISAEKINAIGDKIRVDFKVYNSGSGKVVNKCFKKDDYANKFEISKVFLGSSQGECKAVSGYKIINNKANFYCIFQRNSDSSYASQLVLELNYKYEQETQKEIVVRDLNN